MNLESSLEATQFPICGTVERYPIARMRECFRMILTELLNSVEVSVTYSGFLEEFLCS